MNIYRYNKGLIITIFEYAVATVYQRVALST